MFHTDTQSAFSGRGRLCPITSCGFVKGIRSSFVSSCHLIDFESLTQATAEGSTWVTGCMCQQSGFQRCWKPDRFNLKMLVGLQSWNRCCLTWSASTLSAKKRGVFSKREGKQSRRESHQPVSKVPWAASSLGRWEGWEEDSSRWTQQQGLLVLLLQEFTFSSTVTYLVLLPAACFNKTDFSFLPVHHWGYSWRAPTLLCSFWGRRCFKSASVGLSVRSDQVGCGDEKVGQCSWRLNGWLKCSVFKDSYTSFSVWQL